MIKTVAKSAITFGRIASRASLRLNTQPRVNFSTSIEVSSRLKKAVQ